MPRDPEKAKEQKRKYLRKKKIEKYGEEFADVDMRGRHGNHARGPSSGKWNSSGRFHTSHGYVAVRAEPNSPHAWSPTGRNWYVYDHCAVMMGILGRPLGPDEIVHHINGDRSDNSPSNLRVSTRSEHARAHANSSGARDDLGRFRAGHPRPCGCDV